MNRSAPVNTKRGELKKNLSWLKTDRQEIKRKRKKTKDCMIHKQV